MNILSVGSPKSSVSLDVIDNDKIRYGTLTHIILMGMGSFLIGFYTPFELSLGLLGNYVMAVGIGILALLVVEIFFGFETKARSLENILEVQ